MDNIKRAMRLPVVATHQEYTEIDILNVQLGTIENNNDDNDDDNAYKYLLKHD